MKNEYELQAEKFLADTNTKLTIKFDRLGKNSLWDDKYDRNIYKCYLSHNGQKAIFTFYDSVNNTQKNIKPTAYDILSVLQKYDVGSFEDFCNEFGYDMYTEDIYGDYKINSKARRIYTGCVKEYERLCRLFNDEEMELLREIN